MFGHNKGEKPQQQPKGCVEKERVNKLIDKTFLNFSQVSDLNGLSNSVEILLYIKSALNHILINHNSKKKDKIKLNDNEISYYKNIMLLVDKITKEKNKIQENEIQHFITEMNENFVETRKKYKQFL